MNQDILEKYRKAGAIAKESLEFGSKLIKPDARILEVVEKIENRIKKSGADFAFPINVSTNEVAAHDTADINDSRVFKDGDLVKLDIGVHIDGYIADSAVTVSLNSEKEDFIKVAQRALNEALKIMMPEMHVMTVSEVIEQTIRNSGFNPVINLTGHGLEQYNLHARIEFPNVKTDINYQLKEGDVFAVEPFVTDGGGKVIETDKVFIYRHVGDKPTRFPESRKILDLASEFRGLPFTKRWITQKIPVSPLKLNMILKQLVHNKSLYEYPVLREINNGFVAQAEHTVIVKGKPEVTTA